MKLNLAKYVFDVSSGKFLGFMVSQRGIEANPEKVSTVLSMQSPQTTKQPVHLPIHRQMSPVFQDIEESIRME